MSIERESTQAWIPALVSPGAIPNVGSGCLNKLLGDETASYPGLEIINRGLLVFSNISIETGEMDESQTQGLNKRRNHGFPRYNEHTITRNGTWWDEWKPSSCVKYNEYGDRDFTYQISVTRKRSKMWQAGLDLSFKAFVTLAAKAGYTVTEERSQTTTLTYTIPAGSVGQEWYQYEIYWADIQSRKCGTPPYKKERICDMPPKYSHVDTPIKDQDPQVGWSTGRDKVKEGVCGQK